MAPSSSGLGRWPLTPETWVRFPLGSIPLFLKRAWSMRSRVVVKIGSSSLTEPNAGLSTEKLTQHVSALAESHASGREVILVTSGAIAAGFRNLGLKSRPSRIEEKQAAAAVGQVKIMEAYVQAFARHQINVGQILLTRQDFSNRDSYNNALRTFTTLLKHRIIPIVNENDSVATGEINFGDNDVLAALVASLIKAEMLILLTDTDGLYDSDPSRSKSAKRIERVERVTSEILEGAKSTTSKAGTGGMYSKVRAASQAMANGIQVFVGQGGKDDAIERIISGEGRGTYFGKSVTRGLRTKKQWIAFHAEPCGRITIDRGAVVAILERGKSLLPVGVKELSGGFKAGEVVEVFSNDGQLVGKGISNYSAANLRRVLGKSLNGEKSGKVKQRLEVIHRDDWVPLYDAGAQ